MSIYRQKSSKSYYIRFSIGGRKIRKSARTTNRKEAEEYEQELRKQVWREIQLGASPNYTFAKLANEWLDQSTKKSLSTDEGILKWLRPRLKGWLIKDIGRIKILELRKEKAHDSSKSTANRHMALLRAMLNMAEAWGWIEHAPKVPMYRVIKSEPRWLTKDEFVRLHQELPAHLQALALIAVNTGLRKTPLVEMRRSWIHGNHVTIPARYMKDGKPFGLSLNKVAKSVLDSLPGEDYVFTYKGNRIRQTNTKAWRKALKRAGIDNFRWHDLRSTWASWHVMAGTPLPVLQRLGPWKSYEMVLCYAHLAPDHVASYADNVAVQPPRLRVVK